MKQKKSISQYDFRVPDGFLAESKTQILQRVSPSKPTIHFRVLWGVAASFLLLIGWMMQGSFSENTPVLKEDPFVTDLLLDTLLIEDEKLDEVLAIALLDEFEKQP